MKTSPTTWKLDAVHSEIKFQACHQLIANVTGHFNRCEATAETSGEDFTNAKIRFYADLDSITTHDEHRDTHLKTSDLFSAGDHPKIVFKSDRMEKISGWDYKMIGILCMLDH